MTVRSSRRRRVAGAAWLLALAACGTTTVDPVETVATGPPTTTTLPAGTPAELLARLLAEVEGLSELVVQNAGDAEALARIEALWVAALPGIEAARPDLLPDFSAAMGLTRRSVERRRPADADKAANNLRALIAAYDA